MASRSSTSASATPAARSAASAEDTTTGATGNDTTTGAAGNDTPQGGQGGETENPNTKKPEPVTDSNAAMLRPDLTPGTTGAGQTTDNDGTVRGAGHVAQFGVHSAMDSAVDRPASTEQTARTDGSSLTREARRAVETEYPGAVTVPFGSEPAHIDTGSGKQVVE